MHIPPLLALTLIAASSASSASSAALAAPARDLIVDHSTEALIDKDSAVAVWKAEVDDLLLARLQKL